MRVEALAKNQLSKRNKIDDFVILFMFIQVKPVGER